MQSEHVQIGKNKNCFNWFEHHQRMYFYFYGFVNLFEVMIRLFMYCKSYEIHRPLHWRVHFWKSFASYKISFIKWNVSRSLVLPWNNMSTKIYGAWTVYAFTLSLPWWKPKKKIKIFRLVKFCCKFSEVLIDLFSFLFKN